MIQPQTNLNVANNSGARELMCIRIIGASNRWYAYIGDIVIAVIKKAVPNTPVERSQVITAPRQEQNSSAVFRRRKTQKNKK